MSRVKFTTTINEDLLNKAKEKAQLEGLGGTNDVIEKALRVYFANCNVEVWEKVSKGGYLQKLVVRPHKVTVEYIKGRKVFKEEKVQNFTPQELQSKGFRKVWRMKSIESNIN